MSDINDARARYERFAANEAPGRSEVYREWAEGVATDDEILAILSQLPSPHRQPPVVFAATRMLGSGEGTYAEWAAFVRANADRVVAECAARSTQTNEPLRCAPLMLALTRVRGPIALIEVGASAGLCLFPDRYAYRYGDEAPLGSGSVELASVLRGDIAGPSRIPEIVWRAGIDIQPRDARDPQDRAWIEGLVWPGETERAERIHAALDIAAADPPLMVAGDASEPGALEELVARAPEGATIVITTPGVLPHIPREARERLIATIQGLPARWITIDSAALHDTWDPAPEGERGFLLALDGRPLAEVDPLGGWIAAL
ncbi:hypothetical protein GCM10010922_24170 [Microbacterium sorbitolivorans]|uniref:DUF2332 domain-containing protein n=1 Tax=Microbacterium sorbitolivorans TaxID=1867410 RepID=A0A367XUV9_9MICO|nr:DUF2332 domain-containing protein [Microbacterium sorbitolivorans]RCK57000.1 DUF2332 domain-containing protein [Microbacterium sorbitolivorans]GGF47509.1 hypothetical protein GCM10010922_24170 [Microbacterium sorbitolivorans]